MSATLPLGRAYVGRSNGKQNRCFSCTARLVVGHPKADVIWTSLDLTEAQMNKLQTAAAEFDEIFERFVEQAIVNGLPLPNRPTAVMFTDWGRPDFTVRPREYRDIGLEGSGRAGEWPPFAPRPPGVAR